MQLLDGASRASGYDDGDAGGDDWQDEWDEQERDGQAGGAAGGMANQTSYRADGEPAMTVAAIVHHCVL